MIAQALEVEGAESALATDGQEAIDRLKASPAGFDALLMDLQMPVLDGLAATRLIRGELGLTHLPIIALTAGVLPRQLEEARRAGITEMLAKPVKRERMAEVLRQWVPAKSLPPGARPPHLAMAPSGASAPGQPRPALDPASPFPLIAGIDRERAQEIFCGNRSLFLRFIEDFAARSGGLVAEIRRELARGDRADAARRLHALRGNAGGIGALAVMRTARHLEAALVEGDTAWEPGLRLLDSQLAALIAAITAAGRPAPGPGRQPHP
ncbi:MAG TPA: response regulator [Chromatiaceae bacterium]|nr:response regulator [Chromatiaceae bacterium]